jgi:hypothetical protein
MVAIIKMKFIKTYLLVATLLILPASAKEPLKGSVEKNDQQIPLESMGGGAYKTPGTVAKWVKTVFVPGFQYDKETGKIVNVHPKSYLAGKINPGDILVSIDNKSIHGYKWNYNEPADKLIAVKQELIIWPGRTKTVINQFDCVMSPIQDLEDVEVKSPEELAPKVNI